MKLIIDIDENVFTRLFDNGVDTSSDDREVIDSAIRNGTSYEERPHGEWIVLLDEDYIKTCKCSYCGRIVDIVDFERFPFCNCGADMRGGTQ